MVDGPFGSASEDFLNFETILLVGGELTEQRVESHRAYASLSRYRCDSIRIHPQVDLVSYEWPERRQEDEIE